MLTTQKEHESLQMEKYWQDWHEMVKVIVLGDETI